MIVVRLSVSYIDVYYFNLLKISKFSGYLGIIPK